MASIKTLTKELLLLLQMAVIIINDNLNDGGGHCSLGSIKSTTN